MVAVLLDVVGRCWPLLAVVGRCWPLLDVRTFRRWTFGGWTLDFGRRVFEVACWDAGRWTLDAGRWKLDAGRRALGVGCWTLDTGHWTLDVRTCGRWTRDAGHVGSVGRRWTTLDDVGTLGRWIGRTFRRWTLDVDLKPSDHTMGYFNNHLRSENKKCCGACLPRFQNVGPASAAYSGPLPEPRWFVECTLAQRVIASGTTHVRPAHLSSGQKRCVFGTGSLNI